MMPLRSGVAREDQQARAARLMAEAMKRDVAGQHELIEARAQGETNAVYWERASLDAERQELHEEDRRLRDWVQCTMIQVHLAVEKVRIEVARSKALLGRN